MKLAVIVPTFNSEQYLDTCILSIMHQTLQPDYIIFVDKGSTDRTVSIIQSRRTSAFFFSSIHTKANIGASRNAGLILALQLDADLIAMVDSDDSISNDYLQSMVDCRAGDLFPWVVSSYQRSDGVFVDLVDNPTIEQQLIQNRLSAFVLADPAFLLSVGGYSPLAIAEDWELWYRMMLLGYIPRVNHHGGYNYRVHSKSESSRHSDIVSSTQALMQTMKANWNA